MIEPEGEQVVDRDDEARRFRELLQFGDERRLFLISDRRQRGKTTLLRKLKYICDWSSPRVPCALVRLDDLPDAQPFALVERLYDELQSADVGFPRFQEHRDAIRRRDPAPFVARGYADFGGAHISGGNQAGTIVQVTGGPGPVVVNAGIPAWDASLENYARETATRLFFEDLRAACAQQTVVCLIDSVDEQANRTLLSWVLDKFVRAQVLDAATPPERLVLALAGRPEKSQFNPIRANYPHRVESVEALGAWSNEHVRAFLELNQPPRPPTEEEIDFLRSRINGGDTFEKVGSFVMVLFDLDR